jgi:BMFP domain-containing protein YqiC
MIIYSELTGKQYNTVEECVEAEKRLKEEVQRQKEAKRKEREQLKTDIEQVYKSMVNSWIKYVDLLEKANYDVSSLEDKAILFVEIINDAEKRQEKTSRS